MTSSLQAQRLDAASSLLVATLGPLPATFPSSYFFPTYHLQAQRLEAARSLLVATLGPLEEEESKLLLLATGMREEEL